MAPAALGCGSGVLFGIDKRAQGSYGLCWRGSPHAGEHCHPLKTFLGRDDENISLVQRAAMCPQGWSHPKAPAPFPRHAGYDGVGTSENHSEIPFVHSVPCSGTTQICAKRQFRLGKGICHFSLPLLLVTFC